jgi:hypothetical protein
LCGLAFSCLLATAVNATPYDYLTVGDPLEAELRVLDLLGEMQLRGRIRLPHLGTRPLQIIELQGAAEPVLDPGPVARIALARIERAIARDRLGSFPPHPQWRSTPRLLDQGTPTTGLEISAGIEGQAQIESKDRSVESGSGFQGRISLGLDQLIAFSHYTIGRFDNARRFADPIVPGNDFIVLTEETFLSYTESSGKWGAQFGRSRWHWGPGEEGSLILSKSSAPITGLAFRTRLESLRADAIALSATLREAAGEQLAAHRIEWQPFSSLRIGVTEAARYNAPGWRPLYLMGAIPYVLVQRIEVQNEPDSNGVHRNNVLTAFDAGWRIADGTRVYGEIMIDDLHARSGNHPNKFAYQVGWEGAGAIGASRVTWGGEYTRVTRFVYTSFFGRDHQAQDKPLGFPVAPDARRLRMRLAWDPNPDWQVRARVTHTDKGENDLDDPFVPGMPRVSSAQFEGVVETTRDVEVGVRWWPASGVLIDASTGMRWVRDTAHVRGDSRTEPRIALLMRLTR